MPPVRDQVLPWVPSSGAEPCRNCRCEQLRRRFKRRDLCGKCFYLFECIRTVERWDRARPRTLKNAGQMQRRFGGATTPLDKMSDQDFAAIKATYLDQLHAALRSLRSREARRQGEVRVDGLTIEDKLKGILKVVQLRDRYDRVAERFSGVSTMLDRAFSPEQCRLLYSLLDDIEEQSYGQVTDGHKAFEAVYQNRVPRPSLAERPNGVAIAAPGVLPDAADVPNDLWLVDFRHRLRFAGGWLHAMIVFDVHAGRIVAQAACAGSGIEALRAHLTEAFRAHGMPDRIAVRHGLGRSTFSPLDVWMVEHDIAVDQSARNDPAIMARFDRALRSLGADVLDRAFSSATAAAAALARWGTQVNDAANEIAQPAAAPARPYVDEVVPFEYEPHDIVRRVQERGRVSLFGRIVRVPGALRGKDVALRPTAQEGVLDVLFRAQKIAAVRIRSAPRQSSLRDLPPGATAGGYFQSGATALPEQFHASS